MNVRELKNRIDATRQSPESVQGAVGIDDATRAAHWLHGLHATGHGTLPRLVFRTGAGDPRVRATGRDGKSLMVPREQIALSVLAEGLGCHVFRDLAICRRMGRTLWHRRSRRHIGWCLR